MSCRAGRKRTRESVLTHDLGAFASARSCGSALSVDPECTEGHFPVVSDPTRMRESASHLCRIVTLVGVVACSARDVPSVAQRITIVPLPSPAGPRSAEPFLSSAARNSLRLSWLEKQVDTSRTALRLATLDSAGNWSEPSEAVSASNLFVNWADFPSVVQLADGRLLAHWLQRNAAGKYAYDVRLSQSTDGGKTWTPSVTPHPSGVPAEHGFVTLLPRADSTADILFLNGSPTPSGIAEGHGPPMSVALAHWDRSGQVSDSATVLDSRACDCCQTAAAVTSRGPVLLYRDRSETETRDIAVRRFVDGAWTPPTPLHADDWTINACPVNGPAISANGDTVAAVWFTGARDSAKVQLVFSTNAGATFGTPIRIDAGAPAGRVDVELLDDAEALVTWIERTAKDSAEVRARLVRRDGSTDAPLTIASIPGGRASGFPRMARRRNEVVLAWTVPTVISTIRLVALRIAPR
jgi:hypothetical protein